MFIDIFSEKEKEEDQNKTSEIDRTVQNK